MADRLRRSNWNLVTFIYPNNLTCLGIKFSESKSFRITDVIKKKRNENGVWENG